MVAPEREMPGVTASDCANPIAMALNAPVRSVSFRGGRAHLVAHRIKPVMMSAAPTMATEANISSILFSNTSTRTTVTTVPIKVSASNRMYTSFE